MTEVAHQDHDFFIAVSRGKLDRAIAKNLGRFLERKNRKVFLDPGGPSAVDHGRREQVPLGQQLTQGLLEKLARSQCLIAILGADSKDSLWLSFEINSYLSTKLGSEGAGPRVVPIYLDEKVEVYWKPLLAGFKSVTCSEISEINSIKDPDERTSSLIDFAADLAARIEGAAYELLPEEEGRVVRSGGFSVQSLENRVQLSVPESSSLDDRLRRIAQQPVERFFHHFRDLLVNQLKTAVTDMEALSRFKLPLAIYYHAVVHLLRKVDHGGCVKVTNILSHREWDDANFRGYYLEQESMAIARQSLVMERFFVGEVEEFNRPDVRALIERNLRAGVRVRRVYDEDGRFKRDVGVYETRTKSFVEGSHAPQGYLTGGLLGTNIDELEKIEGFFLRLENEATQYVDRSGKLGRVMSRSRNGWRLAYHSSGPAWQEEVCPMVKEFFVAAMLDLGKWNGGFEKARPLKVVDAGCGDGRNLVFLAQECQRLAEDREAGFEVVGVDICDKAVTRCKERIGDLGLDSELVSVEIYEGNIVEDIPASSDSVDLLVCSDTFGQIHPDEVRFALAEWSRVLRPHGMLLLNSYDVDDDTRMHCREEAEKRRPGSEQDEEFENAWWYKDTYYKYYRENEIREVVERKNQFKVHWIERRDWPDPPHGNYRRKKHQHCNWIVLAEAVY